MTFPSQQRPDPAVAEPRTLAHQRVHSLDQRPFVVARLALAALTGTRLTQDSTSPSLGRLELVLQFKDGAALPGRAYQFPSVMCFSI